MTGLTPRNLGRKSRGLSIQSRFMLYFGAVVVTLMAAVILLVGHRQSDTMLRQTKARGEAVANSIAAVVTPSLLSYDSVTLQAAAEQAKKDAGVEYVVILNKEFEVEGFSGNPQRQREVLDDALSLAAQRAPGTLIQEVSDNPEFGIEGEHLDISVPVYIESSSVKWGTVRVGLSLENLNAEIASTQRVLVLLGVAAVLIVLLSARFFTSRITQPLQSLAAATAEIAAGNLETEMDEDLVGELGNLAHSFNKMVADLRHSRDAIHYQHQHLENMVQERTGALREKARELEKANAELKQVDAMKSDFLSNVSHELRTPLTSIRSFTEIMLDDEMVLSDEERDEFLNIVSSQADRLTRLISDLLDLSKIEAGEFHLQREPLEVEGLVDRVVGTLRNLAMEKGVELTTTLEPDLPLIYGDVDRLSQVLTNLIDNALKFTPAEGSVSVHARVSAERARREDDRFSGVESDTPAVNEYVVFEVRDTGVGIAPTDQRKIFEKFGQVGNVLTSKPQGTGLGLAISGNIMAQHEGAIWVESAPEEGSTFAFSVPTSTDEGELGQPVPEAETRVTGDPQDLVDTLERVTTGKRVLVVDDDPDMVRTLTSLLEPVGFRALGCTSGGQAVAKARDLRPDCILLDTVMPEINGFDVLRLLKADPATAEIPVVIISEGDDEHRAFELGAADCVRKLAEVDELLAGLPQDA